MSEAKTYHSFSRQNNKLTANRDFGEILTRLPPGIYTPHIDINRVVFWFEEAKALSDEILDLPSPEYEQVTQELQLFLQNEIRELFKKYGYLYKRSALLHGSPGTGKTIIVQRVMRDVVALGGIVIYVDDPRLLGVAYKVIDDISPNVLTMVVFEEFDRMAARYEATLLSLLDGEIQKENVIYMATTNYIDKVPLRLRRPGRFASVVEVKYPIAAARMAYYMAKLKNRAMAKDLAVQSKGLSIDEMKEVIQGHIILKQELNVILTRLKNSRDFKETVEVEPNYHEDNYPVGENFEPEEKPMPISNMGMELRKG